MWPAIISGAVGILGSLLGNKNRKPKPYELAMTPEMKQWYNYMLPMIGRRMGQPTQAQETGKKVTNMLEGSYYG